MEKTKRQVAHKVRIKDVLSGAYVKEEGEWSPNYVLFKDLHISRANIIGAVIGAEEENKSFVINDGSESIQVRSFEQKDFDVKVGDIVLVVGRPREFNSERYMMPEIVKKISDKRWAELRKLELRLKDLKQKPKKEGSVQTEDLVEESPQQGPENIINMIKELDKGDGADIQEVIDRSKESGADNTIKNLLKEGEIFEVKPGMLKILD